MTTIKNADISKSEQNKEMVRKVVEEAWNKGNFKSITNLIADDFVIHFSRPGEDLRGLENIKQFYFELQEAFPDMHYQIIDQVAEGDKVVTHWSATGTHKGQFKGIPPTGNKVTFTAMDIDKISDGKFVECWTNSDDLGLMQQLGVIPAR